MGRTGLATVVLEAVCGREMTSGGRVGCDVSAASLSGRSPALIFDPAPCIDDMVPASIEAVPGLVELVVGLDDMVAPFSLAVAFVPGFVAVVADLVAGPDRVVELVPGLGGSLGGTGGGTSSDTILALCCASWLAAGLVTPPIPMALSIASQGPLVVV
ncbi:hypothetical protein ACHAQH_001803 [Verticillium albo-atrum]